jgi:formate dehydrogenase subunit gamma
MLARDASAATAAMTDSQKTAVAAVVERLVAMPGALLPILHGVQDALGYVPPDAVPLIADGLNLSRADVHGVLTFYHYFRTTPPGRHVLHLCRAEACQARRQRELEVHVKERLGIGFHQTTSDGWISLEPVYCLGNCALAPALMVDGDLYGRVDAERFDEIVAGLEAGA